MATQESKKTYKLKLSEFARRKLTYDAETARYEKMLHKQGLDTERSSLSIRVNMAKYYHENYVANLPIVLINARAWCVDERHFETEVALTDRQVAIVLTMAQRDNIELKPNTDNPKSTNGIVTYLLSTFLEAVTRGYLRSTKDT